MHKLFGTLFTLALFLLIATSYAEEHNSSSTKHGVFKGAKPTENPSWFKESFLEFEEDIAEAAAENKRVMLYFYQDGCPYCNALIEHNLAQKDIAELLQNRFDVIAINMWGDREIVSVAGDVYTEKSFAQALKVQFTPTLLFFNEAGKIALRLNGYLPPQNFLLALNYVADKQESKQSYREYIAAHQTPTKDGELNQQVFFSSPPYDLSLANGNSWDRPLAVFFEQKQCPNCDTLHEKVLTDTETQDFIKQFEIIQLDMWSEDTQITTPSNQTMSARNWAKQLGVNFAPTIVFFDKGGKEIIRSEAYFRIFHTQSMFDYVLSGHYQEQPSFQRYISARADALIEKGIDVDIWR